MIHAKDLMIGDWVCIKPLSGYGYTRRKITIKDFANLHKMDYVPIPLTPEILEKNGFKIVHGFGYSESYPIYGWGYHKGLRDYSSVEVTFYDEPIGGVSRLVKMETASKKDDGINSIHSCDIEFVHQLQHALRLCGIEKEIEL